MLNGVPAVKSLIFCVFFVFLSHCIVYSSIYDFEFLISIFNLFLTSPLYIQEWANMYVFAIGIDFVSIITIFWLNFGSV